MTTPSPKKAVKLEIDPTLHAELKACADHYHASVRATIVRYITNGVAADQEMIRRERAKRQGGGGDGG